MISFDAAFDRLMGNEGGYVNNPDDPGGETNWGISKHEYPNLDIKSLTRDQAKAIYKRDYWDLAHASQMCPAMMFQAFDCAVNEGVGSAIRFVQKAAGVKPDGIWGPITMEAVQLMSPARQVVLFVAQRLRAYIADPQFKEFGAGWVKREADNLRWASQDF